MIAAGTLQHQVAIEELTEAPAADGGITETWQNVGTRWASIDPLSGREFMEAQQLNGEVTHRIKMRHMPALTHKHRLKHDGRTFNIVSVLNKMERNVLMEVMCKENV